MVVLHQSVRVAQDLRSLTDRKQSKPSMCLFLVSSNFLHSFIYYVTLLFGRPATPLHDGDPRPTTSELYSGTPSGPAGPQIFHPTGGAFKSMPSPKVTLNPSFDFSKATNSTAAKETARDDNSSGSTGKKWSGSVPSSPVTKDNLSGEIKPSSSSTPPHLAHNNNSSGNGQGGGSLYPSYFGQYDNMLHHQFYRVGQAATNSGGSLALQTSYAPASLVGTSTNSVASFAAMHNKHHMQATGFYPPPQSLGVRTATGSNSQHQHHHQQNAPNWPANATNFKPSVIQSVNKTNTQTLPTVSSMSISSSLPSGSISNGTPLRPPSREVPTTTGPSQSPQLCYAGVMNLKSGTLCGTVTPVTMADLTKPARVKAITATIPVATDLEYSNNNSSSLVPPASPSHNSSSNSNSSVSRQSSAPSTPSTPGMSTMTAATGTNLNQPGLMPPPELPKFVLAPTPAQLGRAPFQRRQSSTTQPSSPNGSYHSSGAEDDPFSPGGASGPIAPSSAEGSSVPPYSPSITMASTPVSSGGFTVPTSTVSTPSTPNVPPSPSQNSGHATKKAVFKRNKDGGVDK